MMPVAWVVLVAVAPFPAAISPGEFVAAQRACLLADMADMGDMAEHYGNRVICHLRDPLRCRLAVRVAWRGWCAGRRGGDPGSGMQSQ
jgi:hypothetical protein